MRALIPVLLAISCTDKAPEDDDEEVGLVQPDIDTDPDTEPDDTEPVDTADADTEPPEDTAVETDHGSIEVSDTSLAFTEAGTVALSIENTGKAALSLSSVELTGDDDAAFSVGSPGASTLAPDSSTTISVSFSPPEESGGWRAEITITSDDPDNEELVVSLAGAVGDPKLAFDEVPLEISDAIIGCERIGTALLRNDGGGFLTVSALAVDGDDELSLGKADAAKLSLVSGDTAEIEIIYLPADDEDDAGILAVESNAGAGSLDIDASAVPYDEGAEFYELTEPTIAFKLSDTPVESSIEVRVDGVDQAGNFTFDAKSNSVVFDGGSIPPADSAVEIEYAIAGGC